MKKIKRHVNCTVPIHTCNLRCSYCYITQAGLSSQKLTKFNPSPEYMAKALSTNRLGGICHINLCAGGETLLSRDVIQLAELLLTDGHFVTLVTNGTITKSIIEICNLPKELQERLFIKFSFHYLELKRLNLLEIYFENVNRIKESDCSFSVELAANDESIPHIDEIKEVCMTELGVLCHIIESRNHVHQEVVRLTEKDIDIHQKAWESFKSPLFNYQQTIWGIKRNEFCYAGDWTLHIHLDSGKLFQCFKGQVLQNIYDDLTEPIKYAAVGTNCPWPHCYSSYVWLTMGGAIPSLKSPYYEELRNRTLPNGEEWLKSTMKEFYSSKPIEMNKEYSQDKKIYINALMAELFDNPKKHIIDLKLVDIIERHLMTKDIESVAIYGIGKAGRWLYSVLEGSRIKIVYTIDKNHNNINLPIECVSNSNISDNVDAIIITPLPSYLEMKKQIEQRYTGKILSIIDIVD